MKAMKAGVDERPEHQGDQQVTDVGWSVFGDWVENDNELELELARGRLRITRSLREKKEER